MAQTDACPKNGDYAFIRNQEVTDVTGADTVLAIIAYGIERQMDIFKRKLHVMEPTY